MSNAIDADGTTLTFNGVEIGGITRYTMIDGVTRDIEHQPLGGPKHYFPGLPEFGQVRLTLYRNPADPGQAEMEAARATRRRETCVLTLSDGSTRTFLAYVKSLPIAGDRQGVGTAQASLKIAGPVT